MSNRLTVWKGVPLPEPRIHYPLSEMDAGDSVILKTKKHVSAMVTTAHRRGIKLTHRRLKNGTYRVWRLA